MSRTPYIGFGNDTLAHNLPLRIGQKITCPRCGGRHKVQGGIGKDGKESDLLLYYMCEGKPYLCGVAGKSILGQRADVSGEL